MSDPNQPASSDEAVVVPVEPQEMDSAANASLKSMPKIIRFESLARCGDEIWIENEGQIYRLRKTRQGKLILTK
jgi:hemin uptake protein HemP